MIVLEASVKCEGSFFSFHWKCRVRQVHIAVLKQQDISVMYCVCMGVNCRC